MREAVVVSIGSSHPWNIAGLGLDRRVGQSFGVRVLTVIAGVTAQDADGVRAAYAVPTDVVDAQLRSLPMEQVTAIRVGALIGRTNVERVADFLDAHPQLSAIVDPVFGATLGGGLLEPDAFSAFRDVLATRANVVLTPNTLEAARLLGRETIERDDLSDAAADLRARGAFAVLLKGGHLAEEPIDALATIDGVECFSEPRIDGAMRGGGCVMAMALASELAAGRSLAKSVATARSFVRSRISAHHHFHGLQVAY